MTDDAPAPLNTDLNGLIDHLKWMYFAQSQPLAWLHYRLAELAGAGQLDPEAHRELQHELSEISQAIWSGTHSFLERGEYVPEDEEGTYCGARKLTANAPTPMAAVALTAQR